MYRFPRTLRALHLLAGLSCLAWSGAAYANGRFPASSQVLVDPAHPDRLWLRSTRGLLTSADHGCAWSWICEDAIGVQGEEDPVLAVTGDGTVLAAVFQGLYSTSDFGCNFRHDYPSLDRYAVDVSVDKSHPERAYVLISAGKGSAGPGNYNQIFRSLDSGQSFSQLGTDLDPLLRPETLDSAPSDSAHLYLTAIRLAADGNGDAGPDSGVLLSSTDDGQHWASKKIPGIDLTHRPYLSGIHPTDPNELYVRVQGPLVGQFVENHLLYSGDGGDTWQTVLTVPADMLGFALSPDGSTVLVGAGDPRTIDNSRPVDKTALGIYRAQTSDNVFTRGLPGHIGCLNWTAQGLYVCTSEFYQGFELGISTDAGKTAEPVMYLGGIKEPLECEAGSTMSRLCTQDRWAPVCRDTTRCDDDGKEQPLVVPTRCKTPTPNDKAPAPDDGSGCGCRSAGQHGRPAPATLAVLALGLVFSRKVFGRKRAARG